MFIKDVFAYCQQNEGCYYKHIKAIFLIVLTRVGQVQGVEHNVQGQRVISESSLYHLSCQIQTEVVMDTKEVMRVQSQRDLASTYVLCPPRSSVPNFRVEVWSGLDVTRRKLSQYSNWQKSTEVWRFIYMRKPL